jgi:histidine ammonia-lyase
MPEMILLDQSPLTPAAVEAVARGGARVRVAPRAKAAMAKSRRVVEAAIADGGAHYGINTGFGSLSRQRINGPDLADLQRNLVRSHAAGVGDALPDDVVRATMLLLAASLARGLSGVRPVIVEALVTMLNAGVTPLVPEVGSVGASGDLAPLAHVALALIGEGSVRRGGRSMPASRALKGAGIPPVTLEAKEGLALINGTHLMASRASLLVRDYERFFDAAVVACAMSIDACRATDAFLDPRAHAARNQPGPARVASRLRRLLAGSTIIPSHRKNDPRVQDPYSLRCAAVVLGAAWDVFGYVRDAVEAELGAVTDNPLVVGSKGGKRNRAMISAGNFHGMPLAIPLDTLALAIAHVAGISERRTYLMLSSADPERRLRPFLSPRPGLHSGLMIAQYTAAACCNEIIGLCMPASVANIPTSDGMEDYNSFGPRAAAKAARALDLATRVVAIELLCAAEGLDAHRPLCSGRDVERAYAAVRARVKPLQVDRPLSRDIDALAERVRTGALLAG